MNNTSTYDSVYQVKLAQIAALQGDTTKKYDSVYQTELEILKKLEEGGMGAQIDDTEVSTGKVWSSYKTLSEIRNISDKHLILNYGDEWTQEKSDFLNELVTEYGTRLLDHLFYASDLNSGSYIACHQYNSTTKTAGFLEYYKMAGTMVSGDLYYSTINLNIPVGSTIQLGNRYNYVGGDQLYVRSQLYTKTEINASINEINNNINALNISIGLKVNTSVFDLVVEDILDALQLKANSADVYTKVQVDSLISEKVKSYNVVEINALTTAEYEAIPVKDPSTMYVITDASI